ncbi:hypothetical protein HGRIS_012718 [Hohenbuehelia grisea]|uniref:Uncharacterized protein n=1 Tax=Hohenbuehelia grisea TaxID=104357 RepID=A0ABR3IT49_9AGAR
MNHLASSLSFLELEGRLRPLTSISTDRYDKSTKVHLSHTQISAAYGSNPSPPYLSEQWTAYTHPEGQLYFCRHSQPRVITEAYLYTRQNLEQITLWALWIENICRDLGISIGADVELFLQIDEAGCGYYFIDHATRSEFWLEGLDTEELGMPEVASETHLKLALEQHYWSHVERFPMHFGGLQTKTVDELICILSYAQIDRMTSPLSTFPYTPEEFTKHIELLRANRDYIADGHATCVVARLWTIVANHRFTTHYGDERSRLSRDQSIVLTGHDETVPGRFLPNLISRLSLGVSDQYLSKISDMFVDDLIYIDQWQKFIAQCFRDWRMSSLNAFALLILHAPLLWIHAFPWLSLASSVLLVLSLISSAFLLFRHESLLDASAGEAVSLSTQLKFSSYL